MTTAAPLMQLFEGQLECCVLLAATVSFVRECLRALVLGWQPTSAPLAASLLLCFARRDLEPRDFSVLVRLRQFLAAPMRRHAHGQIQSDGATKHGSAVHISTTTVPNRPLPQVG